MLVMAVVRGIILVRLTAARCLPVGASLARRVSGLGVEGVWGGNMLQGLSLNE